MYSKGVEDTGKRRSCWSKGLMKTLWEKDQILVTNNSPFPTVFSTVTKTNFSYCHIYILSHINALNLDKFSRLVKG